MKNQSFKVLIAAAMSLAFIASSHAEADAGAGVTINNGTLVSAGTIVYSNFSAFAGAEANTVSNRNSGSSPTASATSTYAFGSGSATIPVVTSFTVNGSASATNSIPGVTAGSAKAGAQIGVSGFFTLTGGTGTVSVTFNIPIVGFTSTFVSVNGDTASASYALTLSLLNASTGTSIRTDTLTANAGTGTGSSGSTDPRTLNDTVLLNYNQQYQVNLLADVETSVTNVPEPTTTAILGVGAVLGFALKRKLGRKAA